MKYYKAPDESIHAIESDEFFSLLPQNCIEIDEQTAKKLSKVWNDLHAPKLFEPL